MEIFNIYEHLLLFFYRIKPPECILFLSLDSVKPHFSLGGHQVASCRAPGRFCQTKAQDAGPSCSAESRHQSCESQEVKTACFCFVFCFSNNCSLCLCPLRRMPSTSPCTCCENIASHLLLWVAGSMRVSLRTGR